MSDLTTQQMIDKAMDDQQPRLASSARCTEIAESGGIGLLEFYELTGIDSDYSLFKINKDGVSLKIADDITARIDEQQTWSLYALKFPCDVHEFMAWYERTRGKGDDEGEKGISDFSLADGFIEAVGALPNLPVAESTSGDQITNNDATKLDKPFRKGRRDKQVEQIQSVAKTLGFDPMRIPDGGKSKIKDHCTKNPTNLFTSHGFDHAWKEALKRNLVRMVNHEDFGNRKKR